MDEPVAGKGTIFQRWDTAGTKWDEISEIKGIDGPSKSRSTIDTTVLNAVVGYKTFIGGLRDGGTVTLDMIFTREGYDLMNADFEDDDLQNYEIILPDLAETSFEFAALVTEIGLSITVDDVIKAPVTLKVSGIIVINSGANSSLHG